MMALVTLTLALAVPAAACDLDGARLVDLTHPFDARTIYWPTAKPFTLEPVAHGMTEGGWWYAANNFSAAEPGGPPLDAPTPSAEGRWRGASRCVPPCSAAEKLLAAYHQP